MTSRKVGQFWVACAALAAGATFAAAQFADTPWPGHSGGASKTRSANAAGPAVDHAFTAAGVGTVTASGITVGDDGSIYFKDFWGSPTAPHSVVRRLDPNTGAVLASSIDMLGNAGDYGGIAVGVDALFVCNHRGAPNTRIYKLHKTTLAVVNEFTNAEWMGLRGTPLIGNHANENGNVNLYVSDREGNAIIAVDSVTGEQMWRRANITAAPFFAQLGPMWSDGERDCIAHFANNALGHCALKDNGDGTWEELWTNPLVGPQNFNWWGSGALSEDGNRIYVTTFNDGDTASLWGINVSDGSVAWSVPGGRDTIDERNFFGRPAVLGNTIYCGGAFNVIAKYVDNGDSATEVWVRRSDTYDPNDPGNPDASRTGPEMTSISAVRVSGRGDEVYIYSCAQDDGGIGRFDILQDNGSSFTEVQRSNLNGAMRWSINSSSSSTIDAEGSVWIGGGRNGDATVGEIYKFAVEETGCRPDYDGDGFLTGLDFDAFVVDFEAGDINTDYDGDGFVTGLDFDTYVLDFEAGC